MAGIRPRCVMAAKCTRCGEEFNMEYDFRKENYELGEREIQRGKKESLLCWECRGN